MDDRLSLVQYTRYQFNELRVIGLNQSTAELLQYYISEVEDFEYACPQYWPPLYIFIYLYDIGKMLNLFPAPDPPYRTCTVTSIFNKFPNSPLFPDLEFIEEAQDKFTTYNPWRSEFFLFTLDYYFHTANGLPYKLIVSEEENLFVSFEEGNISKGTFFSSIWSDMQIEICVLT